MFEALAEHLIDSRRGHCLRCGIDGIDASGKTTFAETLASVLRARGVPTVRASIDGFHHPAEIRQKRGALSPEGYFLDSFNHDDLVRHLLKPLGPGGRRVICRAVFDHRRDQRLPVIWEEALEGSVLVFDGVFLNRRELRSYWDVVIYLDVPFEVALNRALLRDGASFGGVERARVRYEQRYYPGQRIYLAEVQPAEQADFVVDNTVPQHPKVLKSPVGFKGD